MYHSYVLIFSVVMFKKFNSTLGNYNLITFASEDKKHSFTIIPAIGANLQSLVINGLETLDGVADEDEVRENPAYKSTLLAPFPNRTKNGHYTFDGKSYQLDINEAPRNNALHGFIYKMPFAVVNETTGPGSAACMLEYEYDGKQKGYPFRFKVAVNYKISVDEGFSASMSFVNLEDAAIPFGFGWHPYFSMNAAVDNLSLKTPSLKRYAVDVQMIPTGEITAANEFTGGKSLRGVQLDDCFEIVNTGNIVETHLSDANGNTFTLWQETGERKLNFLQIYTPPHRKSVAIEPQTACVDTFNNKYGYFEVEPGETVSASFGVKVHQ